MNPCRQNPDPFFSSKATRQLRTEVEMLAGKYQAQIDNIQAEWDQVAQTIPEKPLEIFKRVTETYDGQAVVVIEQQDGKKGHCVRSTPEPS